MIQKGSAKEEYSLPLIRERSPVAERFLEGRNEEGSFETGIRKVCKISRDSRFVPVNGQSSDRSLLR